ncbi:hypothetical protein K501DRAFT_277472 [Backusella circina FSU 941]|nr:hypothetical protein K501DRAFT_277472 [Backusella circina FSU 941]
MEFLSMQDSSQFIGNVKNMPILTALKIKLNTADLNNLEVLHKNIPSLLELQLTTSGCIGVSFPDHIKPTYLLKHFSLSSSRLNNVEASIKWCNYVVKRYLHLIYVWNSTLVRL